MLSCCIDNGAPHEDDRVEEDDRSETRRRAGDEGWVYREPDEFDYARECGLLPRGGPVRARAVDEHAGAGAGAEARGGDERYEDG